MIEKLSEIVTAQVEAISNMKIDKITVWDSGGSDGGNATANFISGFIKSLPPLQEVAAMAGLQLPEYLGKVKESKAAEIEGNGSKPEPVEPAAL
jgi:flotillin